MERKFSAGRFGSLEIWKHPRMVPARKLGSSVSKCLVNGYTLLINGVGLLGL